MNENKELFYPKHLQKTPIKHYMTTQNIFLGIKYLGTLILSAKTCKMTLKQVKKYRKCY